MRCNKVQRNQQGMHEFFALPLEGNVHSAVKLGIIYFRHKSNCQSSSTVYYIHSTFGSDFNSGGLAILALIAKFNVHQH